MVRGLLLWTSVCMLGCGGGAPIPVERWTLQIAGRPDVAIRVPDELRKQLPDRSVPFTLRVNATIPPELRGRTVSFTIPSAGQRVALLAEPGNVLLTSTGTAKIADFGVAAVTPQARGATEVDSQPLTQTGALLGTPRYMAPELAVGVRDAQPSADIFGFGVMAYERLTTESPFLTPPLRKRLENGEAEPAAPLEVAGIDGDVARCLHLCVDLDPTQRPTANEVLSVLSRSG